MTKPFTVNKGLYLWETNTASLVILQLRLVSDYNGPFHLTSTPHLPTIEPVFFLSLSENHSRDYSPHKLMFILSLNPLEILVFWSVPLPNCGNHITWKLSILSDICVAFGWLSEIAVTGLQTIFFVVLVFCGYACTAHCNVHKNEHSEADEGKQSKCPKPVRFCY